MIPILSPRGGFRQPDVDVLFATPVDPRVVLVFRLVRDYVGTLLTPLILVVFGGRSGLANVQQYLSGIHGNGPLALRFASLAWLLMAFSWVCLSYGLGFLVNRSDLRADRNKKIIDWSIFGIVLLSVVFILMKELPTPTMGATADCVQSPLLRIVYFSGTAASWMVVGALTSNWTFVCLGVSVFISLGGFGLKLAISQIPYMYDQAAVKGFGASERQTLQRNNDFYGLSAQRAREGQFTVGRISRWVGKMRFRGASVLIWKELLLQLRAGPTLSILMGTVQFVLVVVPVLSIQQTSSQTTITGVGILLFVMQSVSALMLTMNSAVSGFIELLRRVDFQKPLPFRPAGTVFWEVSSKCVPNMFVGALATIVVIALRPMLWASALGSELFVMGLSLVLSATVFLVTIAFSDAGDASQRGFRGILILVGIIILAFPGVALLATLIGYGHLNPLLAALPATAVNLAVAVLVSFAAGGLYNAYNPNE